ncbi:MAG: hypothetical protein IPN44_01025 [Flavobacteriales bacterium]|nr:hypothetical protein [Flavobacteriales bacterium]
MAHCEAVVVCAEGRGWSISRGDGEGDEHVRGEVVQERLALQIPTIMDDAWMSLSALVE